MERANLDELFGGGSGQPEPRSVLVFGLLIGGVMLAMMGMLCSAVPGGMVVLVAWHQLERESERLESGYLPPSAKARIQTMQSVTYAAVFLVLVLFVIQAYLFVGGYYDELWKNLILLLLGLGPA